MVNRGRARQSGGKQSLVSYFVAGTNTDCCAESLSAIIKHELEDDMSVLCNNSPLPYKLDCGGKRLTTIGEASAFILTLSDEAREEHHWRVAHMALRFALMEPRYLDTATLTLKTAVTLHEMVQPLLFDVH
jgi:hypothetical protein